MVPDDRTSESLVGIRSYVVWCVRRGLVPVMLTRFFRLRPLNHHHHHWRAHSRWLKVSLMQKRDPDPRRLRIPTHLMVLTRALHRPRPGSARGPGMGGLMGRAELGPDIVRQCPFWVHGLRLGQPYVHRPGTDIDGPGTAWASH